MGGSLVFRFTFRLGVLERIFPLYAQSILGQSWVLGVIVLVGLFVGSAWVMKTDAFDTQIYIIGQKETK